MEYIQRPWGSYLVIQSEETFQVKKLIVNPGKRLSLQSHSRRAEHWFIVSGTGLAEVDGKHSLVSSSDSVDVPVNSKHRISCTSEWPLVFIEVQTGISFDESDILRYEDDFGRSTRN